MQDSYVQTVRRLFFYGIAGFLVFFGFQTQQRLETAAIAADAPFQGLIVQKGLLEPGALRKSLSESGSSEEETTSILSSIRRTAGVGQVKKGDSFRIVRSTDGTFHHLTLTRGKQRLVVTVGAGEFKANLSAQPIKQIVRTARGTIAESLWLSMARINAPAEIIQEYADVFQWTVDFLTEPRQGDTFAVTWIESRTPDDRVWGREIQAARYSGKKTGTHTGILFAGQYFDEKGESLQRMFLRAPLNFRRISSYFSRGRWHPVLRKKRPHHGTDYSAARGTPVVSVGSGRVLTVGRQGGYGKRIEIRHTPVYSTLYGHLNGYAKGIQPGARVRQGQVIGYVGSTGLATGPHLHFQISKNGNWVDFLHLKLPKTTSVSVSNRPAFLLVRDNYSHTLAETALTRSADTSR